MQCVACHPQPGADFGSGGAAVALLWWFKGGGGSLSKCCCGTTSGLFQFDPGQLREVQHSASVSPVSATAALTSWRSGRPVRAQGALNCCTALPKANQNRMEGAAEKGTWNIEDLTDMQANLHRSPCKTR